MPPNINMSKCRVIFYVAMLLICLGLALIGRFYIGTEFEINKFLNLEFFVVLVGR